MPIDMKEVIVEAANTLVFEKKVKRLTVKDIVQECKITRQAFYYHFGDIPELLKWTIAKNSEKLLEECMKLEDPEQGLSYFFTIVTSMKSYTERGLESNYGKEIENLLNDFVYTFFKMAMDKIDAYKGYNPNEKDFMIRYHCQAIIGVLRGWTKEDEKNKEYIIRQIYLMLQGVIHPF